MKFADHLSKADIQKVNQLRRASKNKKEKPKDNHKTKKKNEKFSRRDIEDLMGTRRDTYKRVNGAWRNK